MKNRTPIDICNEELRACDICGKIGIVGEEVEFGPDPFLEEIYGNTEPLWMCEDCIRNSLDEI